MAGLFDPSGRNISGAILGGLQARQQLEEDKGILATQGLSLERERAQQPALLQQAALDSVIQTARSVSALPDRQSQLDFLIRNKAAIEERRGDSSHTDDGIRLLQEGAQTGDFGEFDASIGELVGLGQPAAKPFTLKPGDVRFEGGQEVARGLAAPGADGGFTLSPGQQRFGPEGQPIAGVPEDRVATQEIPPELIIGLDEAVARKGAAAFKAAGGGNDGLKAFSKIVDQGSELERRQASPQIIQATFPNATEAERSQLQGVMDSAKTTESGLKAAAGVREEQRRTKKAQGFQDRAVTLLDSILASGELDDVLGSVEGAIDFRFQDSEAELIADIEEAENILTADNMDLMTGVLSESDIKILKNLAGGGLNRRRTSERFRADVQAIRDKLASQKVTTIDEQRAEQAPAVTQTPTAPPSGREGGQLMTDADGNKAFVFPDGTFEEV